MDKLYTIAEVATKLNLSDKTLRRWEEAGRFHPTRTLGNQRRYTLEDLQILDAIKHNTIPDQDDLLNIEQAAKFCGVSIVTIGRWENGGKLHPFITSGNTYYPRHVLIEKLSGLKTTPLPEEETVPQPPVTQTVIVPTPLPPEIKTPAKPVEHLTPLLPQGVKPGSGDLKPYFINFLVTLALILMYHLIVTLTTNPLSPQGASTTPSAPSTTASDTTMDLLKKYIDPTGALMTPTLLLSPASTPTNPNPGTLYYDASAETLKLYKSTGWSDIGATQTIRVSDGSLISGTATLPRGKNQITISNEQVIATSLVTANFTTDYAPAKKYWITVNPGSFTVHTDFPVAAAAPFNYLLLTTPVASASASPSATLK